MRQRNFKFANLKPGTKIEVRPDLYDRDWTEATVERVTYTDIPLRDDPYTKMLRRYELFVRITNRKNYCPLILDENDMRECQC